MDGYEKSGAMKSIPLDGQVCKKIDIKERLLERPKANEHSEAEWLRDAECEINEKNYSEIEVVGEWYHDEVLTTGLALIERILGCKSHRISICDPWTTNASYAYNYQPGKPFEGHEIASKYRIMDFIVLPISDGFAKIRLKGEAGAKFQNNIMFFRESGYSEEDINLLVRQYQDKAAINQDAGSHWYVMIVDCRGKGLRSMYFDSWKDRGYKPNVAVIRDVQRGLFRFFQYDQSGRYVMDKAECSSGLDMNYAVECHEDEARTGVSVPIELALPEGYNVRCGWDSEKVRCDLRNLIDRERRVRTYLSEPFGGTHAWFDDRATGKLGWKTTLARFGMPACWVWDPHTLESVFKNGNVMV